MLDALDSLLVGTCVVVIITLYLCRWCLVPSLLSFDYRVFGPWFRRLCRLVVLSALFDTVVIVHLGSFCCHLVLLLDTLSLVVVSTCILFVISWFLCRC